MIKKFILLVMNMSLVIANENKVNEPPNAILRDFDDYLMDDAGHIWL